MTIKFVITIADTSVVNLSIDPNINIITQSHLDEIVDALKKETTANLANKADKSVTYTKTEVNNLLNTKENKNVAKGLVDALKKETTANLANKADKSVTYTKTEVNNLLNSKENVGVAKGLVDALRVEIDRNANSGALRDVTDYPPDPNPKYNWVIPPKNYSCWVLDKSLMPACNFKLYYGNKLLLTSSGSWRKVTVTCNNNNN